MRRRAISLLIATAAFAGCSRAPDPPPVNGNDDPVLVAALDGPLASDPDLAAQNRANAVAALPSIEGSVPTVDVSAQAIAAARGDALAVVGGPGQMRTAPEPRQLAGVLRRAGRLNIVAFAAAMPALRDCASTADYTAAWAAKLPAAFPVYPRGAVLKAAGSDSKGCALRAVNFQTPVPAAEVIDFYFSQASKAGFSARHLVQDAEHMLSGAKGPATYVVYVRKLSSGVSEVALITGG